LTDFQIAVFTSFSALAFLCYKPVAPVGPLSPLAGKKLNWMIPILTGSKVLTDKTGGLLTPY
jgi:hypothetical protein